MVMDTSIDIHVKSLDVDMDMDGKFHIHGKPDCDTIHHRSQATYSRNRNRKVGIRERISEAYARRWLVIDVMLMRIILAVSCRR